MTKKVLRRMGLFVLFLIAVVVTACNIDWIVSPFFAREFGHIQLEYRVLIVSILSLVGASYIYWFGRLLDGIIIEYEQNGQTVAVLSASSWWWDRVKAWFIRRHKKALHPENKWIKYIKRYGYPAIVGIGIIPEFMPGARTTLVSFCAAAKWRSGFVLYLFADFLKNIGMSAAFGWIFHH